MAKTLNEKKLVQKLVTLSAGHVRDNSLKGD